MAWWQDGDWNKGLDDEELYKPFSPLKEVFEPAEDREDDDNDKKGWW